MSETLLLQEVTSEESSLSVFKFCKNFSSQLGQCQKLFSDLLSYFMFQILTIKLIIIFKSSKISCIYHTSCFFLSKGFFFTAACYSSCIYYYRTLQRELELWVWKTIKNLKSFSSLQKMTSQTKLLNMIHFCCLVKNRSCSVELVEPIMRLSANVTP